MTTLVTQLLTLLAAGLAYEATQWIEVGYGLNPLIALPLATIIFFSPYVLRRYI